MVNCRTSLYLFVFFFKFLYANLHFVLLTHHSFMAWWNVIRTFSYLVFFYVFHYFVFKRNCAENVLVIGNFFSTSSSSLCFDYQTIFTCSTRIINNRHVQNSHKYVRWRWLWCWWWNLKICLRQLRKDVMLIFGIIDGCFLNFCR